MLQLALARMQSCCLPAQRVSNVPSQHHECIQVTGQPLLLCASVSPPGKDIVACSEASLASKMVSEDFARSKVLLPWSLGADIAAL